MSKFNMNEFKRDLATMPDDAVAKKYHIPHQKLKGLQGLTDKELESRISKIVMRPGIFRAR
jgi:hypothetical protein